jgi:hypothetical protein
MYVQQFPSDYIWVYMTIACCDVINTAVRSVSVWNSQAACCQNITTARQRAVRTLQQPGSVLSEHYNSQAACCQNITTAVCPVHRKGSIYIWTHFMLTCTAAGYLQVATRVYLSRVKSCTTCIWYCLLHSVSKWLHVCTCHVPKAAPLASGTVCCIASTGVCWTRY